MASIEELGGDEAEGGDSYREPEPRGGRQEARGLRGASDDKEKLPATRKQLNYLESLIGEAGEGGAASFEQKAGKPLSELTRGEASEWIGRLSGRAA